MRHSVCLLAPLLLFSGCASMEYHDTNAAVDARPECAGTEYARNGEGVPGWCDRSSTVKWSSSGTDSDSAGLHFGGKDED